MEIKIREIEVEDYKELLDFMKKGGGGAGRGRPAGRTGRANQLF